MKLVQVEIIDNPEITGTKNPLQYIERSAQAMFVDYNKDASGGIYLMKESAFRYAGIELDTIGIEWKVVSRHKIKGAEERITK